MIVAVLSELPASGWAQVGVAFLAGIASFASPCVLPLVPVYLSLVSGVATRDLAGAIGRQRRRLLVAVLGFIAGYTVVFVAMGATASALGSLLAGFRPILERMAGVVIVLIGLLVAGIAKFDALGRDTRADVSTTRFGALAPPVMGAAFAFGWSPCIGPILGAILTMSASTADLRRGVLLLLAYSAGLGVPFIAAGLAFGRLTSTFSWAKRHAIAIRFTSGCLLVAFGILLLTGQLPLVVRA